MFLFRGCTDSFIASKITKVSVAFPEGSKEEDYLLEILEGSNDPTFIDAEPIYMVIDKLNENSVNYFEIKTTKKYESIRYICPNNKNCIQYILSY